MKIVNRLYKLLVEKLKIFIQKRNLKWKKYYLDKYGVYRNADNLNRIEILEILFKIFKNFGYKGPELNEEINISMAIKRLPWGWLDAEDDIADELVEVFDFSVDEVTDKEHVQIKTLGELADLIIKKAKKNKTIRTICKIIILEKISISLGGNLTPSTTLDTARAAISSHKNVK